MINIPEDDRVERATVPTTLGDLRVGDLIPGWFGLCRVTVSQPRDGHRHYVELRGREEAGQESGPASTPWRRVPREEEEGGPGHAATALS